MWGRYIELPDEAARIELLKMLLAKQECQLSHIELRQLAKATPYFTKPRTGLP